MKKTIFACSLTIYKTMLKIKTIMAAFMLSMASLPLSAKTYYMATNGSDSNSGTVNSPFATLAKAQAVMTAGDTLLIREGTYVITEDQISSTEESIYKTIFHFTKSGTAAKPICFFGYPGERPVFDLSNVKPAGYRIAAFYIHANYLYFKNFEVVGCQVTITSHTQSEVFTVRRGNYNNTFENLAVHDGMGIGFVVWKGSNNLFLNCDAYNNYDSVSEGGSGENTDGFGCHVSKAQYTGNVFRGCRAWRNSDDGFDCISNYAAVTFDSCWAWENGYDANLVRRANGNGIKAGGYGLSVLSSDPGAPVNEIKNCITYRNPANGFYSNHHLNGDIWYNNSAYANGYNYDMRNQKSYSENSDVSGYNHDIQNCLSYQSSGSNHYRLIDKTTCTLVNNTFLPTSISLSASDFESLDASQLSLPRKADGSLPDITFLKLKSTSKAYAQQIGYQFDDDVALGIETITVSGEGCRNDNVYYNLMGQPVENPVSGIYILNGRKVVVK